MNGKREAPKLVADATSGADAVRALYSHYKALDRRMSLAFLCAKAGIASKGYLSDVMRGRRILHPRYAEPLAAAFGLRGPAARALVLLVQLESEDLDAGERAEAVRRLAVLRRGLAVERTPVPAELARMAAAFEVYCAFGLFANEPTLDDLAGYFGERHRASIESALTLLAKHKLVVASGPRFRATKTGLIFGASTGLEHLDFLRSSLRDAQRHLKHWFPKQHEAYIESVIISVKREDYLERLPLLRERVLEERTRLDTEDADMLLRFNIQVYPVRREPSA